MNLVAVSNALRGLALTGTVCCRIGYFGLAGLRLSTAFCSKNSASLLAYKRICCSVYFLNSLISPGLTTKFYRSSSIFFLIVRCSLKVMLLASMDILCCV